MLYSTKVRQQSARSDANAKGGRLKRPHSIGSNQPKQNMTESQKLSASIYKQLFTDSEWQIIDYALSEYQDHLDEDDNEIEIYNSIQAKLNAIFTLTK